MRRFVERGTFWVVAVLAIALIGLTPRQAFSEWSIGEPIVTFWGGHDLSYVVADRDVRGGYNLDWASSMVEVGLAEKFGLRSRLRSDHNLGSLLTPETMDSPVKIAELDALIAEYKTYSSAYAYYITDEPTSKADIDSWAPLITYLQQEDPDRVSIVSMGAPSWVETTQNGGEPGIFQHYIDTLNPKLLFYNFYSLIKAYGLGLEDANGPPYDEADYLSNLQFVAGLAKANDIPFMNGVQAIVWEDHWRLPNEDELRFLVYSTLTYGAQGISYFNYYQNNIPEAEGGIQFNPDRTPTATYTALQTLNPEFSKVATELQSVKWIGAYLKGYHPQSLPPDTEVLPAASPFDIASVTNTLLYQTGDPLQEVLIGLFSPDGTAVGGATYALVENLDYSSFKIYTLTGPGDLSIFDATTGIWTPTGSNQAILNLPKGGGVLVRLTVGAVGAVPEPSTLALLALALGVVSLRRSRS